MFELKYLGHAGWLIENSGIKILCDPWLSASGCFYNSWHQFPDNSHIDVDDVLGGVDILYISHSHLDHYDEHTLAKMDKKIQVLVADFNDPILKNSLDRLGFENIRELSESEIYADGALQIKILKEENHLDKDSLLYVSDGMSNVLNLNDCHPSRAKIESLGPIDLLLLQASSALWYPCVYDYDEEKKKELCRSKKKNVLNRAVNYIRWTKAECSIPNAGPIVFLEEQFRFWDETRREDFNPFPLNDESADFIEKNGFRSELLIPGDMVRVSAGELSFDKNEEKSKEIYSDVNTYIEKYRKSRKIEPSAPKNSEDYADISTRLEKQFMRLHHASQIFKQKLNYAFKISFGSAQKVVDFRKPRKECYGDYVPGTKCRYEFVFDPDILRDLLSKKCIDFDDYFLSLKFEARRNPDEYDDILFSLFRNFDVKRLRKAEELFALQNQDIDKTFVFEHNNKKYKAQKYCPHMLADLESTGHIDEEGYLVCPIHNWKFCLKTGRCSNSASKRLKIEEIRE